MDRDTFDQRWWPLAQEILAGMKQWRLQHPTASFSEIEATLDQRLGLLRARMLEDTALASDATSFGHDRPDPPPLCPSCSTPLNARGDHTRRLITHSGQEISLTRTYGSCPACKAGLFPPG